MQDLLMFLCLRFKFSWEFGMHSKEVAVLFQKPVDSLEMSFTTRIRQLQPLRNNNARRRRRQQRRNTINKHKEVQPLSRYEALVCYSVVFVVAVAALSLEKSDLAEV
jgi:hypothetical protein